MIRPVCDALLHAQRSAHKNDLRRHWRQLSWLDPRVGIGDSRAMSNIDTIHRGFVQAIRWLAPASCVLCRHLHNRARAICLDCEAAFSRNQHACHRCALPLQPTHSRVIDGFAPARISAPRLCPTCIKRPPPYFGAHAPYLMRTGMRDLIHLWKFQNRPQLTGLLAELLLSRLPTAAAESLPKPGAAAHTVLVPILPSGAGRCVGVLITPGCWLMLFGRSGPSPLSSDPV